MKRQLRTRLSLLKPSIATWVEDHQQKMKINHDKGHYSVKKFEIGEKVQVKTTVQAGKWKWLPGNIHKVMGPLTYLGRVGNRTRYCHCDHLLSSKADIPQERPNVDIDSSIIGNSAPSPADGTVLAGTPESTPPARDESQPLATPDNRVASSGDRSPSNHVLTTPRRYPTHERSASKRLIEQI
jgi:hypothetical protein